VKLTGAIVESHSVAYARRYTFYASFCPKRNYDIVVRVTPTEQRFTVHVSSRIFEVLMKGDHCKNLQELTRVVVGHAIYPDGKMLDKRKAFAEYVAAFHNDAQIPLRVDHEGIVLMSAHQPNLFPYSGVVRKAVLVHAVAEQLRKELSCPVTELFCFADQDFAEERWFREAQLPSVRSRNGTLSLYLSIAQTYKNKIMRAVPKPDNKEVEKIKSEIQRWTIESRDSITKHCKHLGLQAPDIDLSTHDVFEVIDRASERSTNAADFNAFFFAYLIQECGYETAFARFSQCQHVFKDEIAFMLEHFDQYAKLIVESQENPAIKTPTPIWYHCPCNGKADVEVVRSPDQKLVATCRACNTTVEFTGGILPALEQMLPNVSLRAESMLIAFGGIGITFYVGGKGGAEYLSRASRIAEELGMQFPVVSIWRPRDVYGGVGQLDAILELLRVRSEYELMRNGVTCDAAIIDNELDLILADIDEAISALDNLKRAIATRKAAGVKEQIAFVVNMQNNLKTRFERNKIARDHSIVTHTKNTVGMMPSIIDHAINIGMRSTATQWLNALEGHIHFDEDVQLKTSTSMDALFDTIKQLCTSDLFE
jgi:hypothetical protein